MSDDVRAFVAIRLSTELMERLLQLQERLATELPRSAVRWSRPEQLHLTLKFLGQVPLDRLEDLKSALASATAGAAGFRLGLEGVGAFPNRRQPRVLWVGLTGELEPLHGLQQRVEAATAGVGDHTEERDFHPHLTLGRVSSRAPHDQRAIGDALPAYADWVGGEWVAQHVFLVRSQLLPTGAVYTPLAEFPLTPRA